LNHEDHSDQTRLLLLAAIILGIYSAALTLAPAARARSWDIDLRWQHWLGTLVWLAGFWIADRQSHRFLERKDSHLLPVVALINGWGLLTIWRLIPAFGLRQTIWLSIGLIVFTLGLRLPSNLEFLRRYKYLWLTSGLLLTALTLIFGTNPLGYGPRLWLGCCGIYLQPSEPLKLLLVVYLSAFFADWAGVLSANGQPGLTDRPAKPSTPQLKVLFPTIIMTGLALLLLLVQRDLGTAFIFIFLYSVMVFLATGWWSVPLASLSALVGAGLLGYRVFDVIRLRVDAWLNPWLDPTGRSYQIVQSLLAVANGGILGRGPGLGNPSLVPVTHSDFIFAAIAEESGLLGIIGFLVLLGLLAHSGFRIALQASDPFRRFLAAGLTAFLVSQSVLIIGGNLRLVPLTGVTLPFVSYGGSSLLVSLVAALLLLQISTSSDTRAQPLKDRQQLPATNRQAPSIPGILSSILKLSTFLIIALLATALVGGWWAYIRGPDLLTRTDNPRRAVADRSVPRGTLLDRRGAPIAETIGPIGDLKRVLRYADLGPIIGYSHPIYGQSGLEASLDPILRGVEGNDPLTIWWNHLLYGQPPPGLNIRLTLDISLQRIADGLLGERTGALILLNAETGEILVMASHPTFDPNELEDQWDRLIQDPLSPLLNRVTQGSYPTGKLGDYPFIQAIGAAESGSISLRLPLVQADYPSQSTPLQIALAAAAVTNNGYQPVPSIAQFMGDPKGGWLLLPALDKPDQILSPQESLGVVQSLTIPDSQTWQIVLTPDEKDLTWYLGGTTGDWDGIPMALVLVLEEANIPLAVEIGQALLNAAGPDR